MFVSESLERPEGCRRGPPPAVEGKLEDRAAAIPAPGLCTPEELRDWFKSTKEEIKGELQTQMSDAFKQELKQVGTHQQLQQQSSSSDMSQMC